MIPQLSLKPLIRIVSLATLFLSLFVIHDVTPTLAGDGDDVSPIIHYQGQLPEPAIPALQGKITSFTFALYDAEDEGNELWRETQDLIVAPNGSFHALLGTVTSFSTVPGGIDALFPDAPRWLRVLTPSGDELVPPRQMMSATGTVGFRPACPEDMSDLGTFCIDTIPVRSRVSWYASTEACEAQEKRLCTNTEWLDACDSSPANRVEQLPPPKNESEWLANWVFETSSRVFASIDRGYYRCATESHAWPSDRPYAIKWYRCCK